MAGCSRVGVERARGTIRTKRERHAVRERYVDTARSRRRTALLRECIPVKCTVSTYGITKTVGCRDLYYGLRH